MSVLEIWNAMSEEAAADAILPCCGSRAWARAVAARRPLHSEEALLAASDAVWQSLDVTAWDEAFRSHPRIGQKKSVGEATTQSLQWSAGEQNAADMSDEEVQALLASGNIAYEHKFGRIFIVCATGKTAREMLEVLNERLENDIEPELLIAAEEQRKITQLRLQKWLRGV